MSTEILSLPDKEKPRLETEGMTREVRNLVRNALKGTEVHPVSMDFSLAHPILHALGLRHDGSYSLMLALKT
jgi:hypothetical protein